MNDEELAARLGRWQPAAPPADLLRRLHSAVPMVPVARPPWWRAAFSVAGSLWRPWPLAYAGLAAAWALILALRLLTPVEPLAVAPANAVAIDSTVNNTPAVASMLATERTLALARTDPNYF